MRSSSSARTRSGNIRGLRLERERGFGKPVILRAQIVKGRRAGQGLDPAHTRPRTRCRPRVTKTPISPVWRTWVPPQSSSEYTLPSTPFPDPSAAPHGNDPHLLAVFLPKQRLGAQIAGFIWRHNPGLNGRVLPDKGIHVLFDLAQFRKAQRFGVAEIKPQPILGIQRSPLRHVVTKGLAQCASWSRCVAE